MNNPEAPGLASMAIASLYNDGLSPETMLREGASILETGQLSDYHLQRQTANLEWLVGRRAVVLAFESIGQNELVLGQSGLRRILEAKRLLDELQGESDLPDQWLHHIEPRRMVAEHFYSPNQDEIDFEQRIRTNAYWRGQAGKSEHPIYYRHAVSANATVKEIAKRKAITVTGSIAMHLPKGYVAKRIAHRAVA